MALSFAASYALIMLVFWATLFLPRSVSGAIGSAVLLARTCMPVFLFAAAFVSSTKIGDLTVALYSLRLPRALVVPLAVCVRFFPTLGQEAGAVLTSMHLRGLGLSPRNVVAHPVLTFESLLVPLMLRCAKIADELEEWRLADHIVVIDDGRVVEEGSHGLLLERKGLYARLWELQHESAGWNVERR